MRDQTGSIEVLEARIAPALFFVSGAGSGPSALKVLDEAGNTVNDAAAQTAAGSTASIPLHAGDKLIFDKDHNHRVSTGDATMVIVDSGSAMAFLTDGPTGKKTGAFELTELTGLAVSDAFSGSVRTDVNGTVATALNSLGQFTVTGATLALQDDSIAKLEVRGQIAHGSLIAGRDLANVTIGGPLLNRGTSPLSVEVGIATGSATVDTMGINTPSLGKVSFNGGSKEFAPSYTPAAGVTGGSITDVKLSAGTPFIAAGNGGTGAAGGSISGVQITAKSEQLLFAGDGGDNTGILAGGAGGSIENVKFSLTDNGYAAALAGRGGDSPFGDGGDGGHVADLKVSSTRITGMQLRGGDGGDSTEQLTKATGGDGGDLSNITANLGRGLPTTAAKTGFTGNVYLEGGFGGRGGTTATFPPPGTPGFGGAGGSIDHLTLVASGQDDIQLELHTGPGGSGGTRGGEGTFSDSQLTFQVRSALVTLGGSGGVSGVKISDASLRSSLSVGADLGGNIENLTFNHGKGTMANFSVSGQAIDQLKITNAGTITSFRVLGFESGDVSNVSVVNSGRITGGGIASSSVTGGSADSGDVHDIEFRGQGSIGQLAYPFLIGTGSSGSGGSVGTVRDLILSAPRGDFLLGTLPPEFLFPGSTGGTPTHAGGIVTSGGVAGHGGDLAGIKAYTRTLSLVASDGGDAPNGTGGRGGKITDVLAYTTSGLVTRLEAGDGGDGLNSGAGGSISQVEIQGDIGFFADTYRTSIFKAQTPFATRLGGLIVGKAGTADGGIGAANGSIDDVAAKRISLITAGFGSDNTLRYDNAVTSIVNLKARTIGADVRSDGGFKVGRFDFDNDSENANPTFEPSNAHGALDGDIPVDGFVIVKNGGLTTPLPVTPLFLIQV